jgi:hypothetical protein
MKTYTIKEIEKAVTKAGCVSVEILKHLEGTYLERIDTFEDACEAADMSDELPFDQYTKDSIEISTNAFYQLCVITKALNEDWKIDIKDKKQEVWVNWFDLRGLFWGGNANDGASAGFGCSLTYYAPSSANTNFGSRLCFRGKKEADYSRIHFNHIWIKYLLPDL